MKKYNIYKQYLYILSLIITIFKWFLRILNKFKCKNRDVFLDFESINFVLKFNIFSQKPKI